MNQKENIEELAITHYYPKTTLRMIPGDVLYSHKYAFSSFLVGHTAIVGTNFRIYHVNRWKPIGHADSMAIYLSRHLKREKITILRHDNEQEAERVARWAMHHVDEVKEYTYKRDLKGITKNYCSKFTWQAFYFGTDGKVDLRKKRKRTSLKGYIMPGSLYRRLRKVSTLVNALYH